MFKAGDIIEILASHLDGVDPSAAKFRKLMAKNIIPPLTGGRFEVSRSADFPSGNWTALKCGKGIVWLKSENLRLLTGKRKLSINGGADNVS